MSVTVDQIIERYTLDDRFSSRARKVQQAADGIGQANRRAGGGMQAFGNIAQKIGSTISGVFRGLGPIASAAFAVVAAGVKFAIDAIVKLGTAAAGVAVAIAGFAGLALNAAADMDSLKRGLLAVAGSGEEAERQLLRLEKVAKLPGLGFKQVIEGATVLQASELTFEQSERALLGFGNALATVGRGKEDLEGVIRAIGQIQSKDVMSAEEINQLAERVPQIRKVMKQAFGSGNPEKVAAMGISVKEFINGVSDELLNLPKVTGGIKNSFENLQDSIFRSMSSIGMVVAEKVLPTFETISQFLEFSVKSGLIERITRGFTDLFSAPSESGVVSVLATVAATMQSLPGVIKVIGSTVLSVMSAIAGAVNTFIQGIQLKMNMLMGPLAGAGLKGLEWIGKLIWGADKALTPGLDGFEAVAAEVQRGFAAIAGYDLAGKIAKGRDSIMGGFSAFAAQAKKDDPATPEADKPKNQLAAIVRNTMETAKNTRETVSLQRFGIGGGDLGQIGITPVEMARARSGKTIDVRVTGADESLNQMFSEFLRRALPLAAMGRA